MSDLTGPLYGPWVVFTPEGFTEYYGARVTILDP